MNLFNLLGRAASHVEGFAAGLCLTVAASALLFAGEAQAQAAGAAAAPAPVARAAGDGPPLWVIRDADSTIYLYGTIHLLRPGTAWGSDKVDTAFDSASEVWFEISNPDDQASLAPIIQQYGFSPDQPLSGWLTADEKTVLERALQPMGATPAQIDPARPWFAALMVGTSPLTQAGFDAAIGADGILRARAVAAGKTIKGFETADQQIRGLAEMSDEGQKTYLRYYLATYETSVAQLDAVAAGWAAGDISALETYAHENGRAISEETHQVFLARRNADWANQIENLLKGSGTAFIAVGSAHLVGDDSVQTLLAQKGIVTLRH